MSQNPTSNNSFIVLLILIYQSWLTLVLNPDGESEENEVGRLDAGGEDVDNEERGEVQARPIQEESFLPHLPSSIYLSFNETLGKKCHQRWT